jgi:hypothetical protein
MYGRSIPTDAFSNALRAGAFAKAYAVPLRKMLVPAKIIKIFFRTTDLLLVQSLLLSDYRPLVPYADILLVPRPTNALSVKRP